MTFVVILLSVVVALLAVLVTGLLRSHAEILRRLHELGAGLDTAESDTAGPRPTAGSRSMERGNRAELAPPVDTARPRPSQTQPSGRPAADITGTTLAGDALALGLTNVAHDTVLIFLSSGCTTCAAFWDALATPETMSLPTGARLVVVTRGTQGDGAESPSELARLASPGITVVMSDTAWSDYQVEGTPYVIHVDGPTGRIRGEGTGLDWPQVSRLLAQATGDLAYVGQTGRRRRKAARDAERERRMDNELIAAGILPGDERLYLPLSGDTGDIHT